MINDYSEEEFKEIYDFYSDLDNQSKIIVSMRIMEEDYEYILDIIDSKDNIVLDYLDDDFEEDDVTEEDFEEDTDSSINTDSISYIEDLINIKTKSNSSNKDIVLVIMDYKERVIHLNSESEIELEKFIKRNLFLRGIFMTRIETSDKPPHFMYKFYRKYNFLGQLEQDLCLN